MIIMTISKGNHLSVNRDFDVYLMTARCLLPKLRACPYVSSDLSGEIINSSPPVRFYQKIEWASKSICLLAQKVY